MQAPSILTVAFLVVLGCGDDDAGGTTDAAATIDGASSADASAGSTASDDFERSALGSNWTVRFPSPDSAGQVQIISDSDLGMGVGPQGFFLINWTADTFPNDQFCQATIPSDATPGWAYMVYVRWRSTDGARYGFAYNSDPGQPSFGNWIFKYDGVPSSETRVFAMTPATAPQPGDTIRVEVEGFTLRGYHNGTLVLEATDTDSTRIAAGETGLAARWSNGNMSTDAPAKVWESWSGGEL